MFTEQHKESNLKRSWQPAALIIAGTLLNLAGILTHDGGALIAVGCSLIAVGAAQKTRMSKHKDNR